MLNVLNLHFFRYRKTAIGITKPLQLLENNEDDKPNDDMDLVNHINENAETSPVGYRFSIGQLPLWAKKQVLSTYHIHLYTICIYDV